MSYGRHQSFYIKDNWLNKGIKAVEKYGSRAILDKDMYKLMGIGKNMHQSLRYWLETINIVKFDSNIKEHNFSEFGEIVKEHDPSARRDMTLLLIQYFLVYNHETDDSAETFVWFFKEYEESSFLKDNLKNDLIDWNKGKTSSKTLSRDVDCLIQTYTNNTFQHPEDKNVSLLAKLELVKKIEEIYVKYPLKKEYYSYDAFYFILLFMKLKEIDLSIENLMNHKNGLAKAYNFSRADLVNLIDDMSRKGYSINITRTNNLDYVNIESSENAYTFLAEVYDQESA